MSLNPTLGHLYHDYSITNSLTALDAKEKMRTREINARESKQLEKYTYVLDRAKNVCQRQNDREQRYVKKDLVNIKTKTVSLDRSLKKESQRLKLFDDIISDDAPVKHSRAVTFINSKRLLRNRQQNNFISSKSLYSMVSQEQSNHIRESQFEDTKRNDVNSKHVSSKTAKIARKADQVTKSLHKLYTKSLERRWKDGSKTLFDILSYESNEDLERALFVLRGTHAGNLVEDILKERKLSKRSGSNSHHSQTWSVSSAGSNLSEADNVFVTELSDRHKGIETEEIDKSSHRSSQSIIEKQQSEQNGSTEIRQGSNPSALKMVKTLQSFDHFERNRVEYDTSQCHRHYGEAVNKITQQVDADETKVPEDKIPTELNEGDGKIHITDNEFKVVKENSDKLGHVPILKSESNSSDSSDRLVGANNGINGNATNKWINVADVRLNLTSNFEKQDPDCMSIIANPSEQEYKPTLKWREIFKTPEVWKLNRNLTTRVKKPKPLTLVKVHGQYRQTMLK